MMSSARPSAVWPRTIATLRFLRDFFENICLARVWRIQCSNNRRVASLVPPSREGGSNLYDLLGRRTARVSRADFFSAARTFDYFSRNQTFQTRSAVASNLWGLLP